MKTAKLLLLLSVMTFSNLAFAELRITNYPDHVLLEDWMTEDHCAFSPEFQVDLSHGDSIVVIEHDTSEGIAVCTCNFFLDVTFPNPAPGEYTVYVYRSYTESFMDDSLFFQGSIDFFVESQSSGGQVLGLSSGCQGGMSVKEKPSVPDGFVMYPAYPNPFNPVTTLDLEVPTSTDLTLSVHDIKGALIWQSKRYTTTGYNTLKWFGMDSQGRPQKSGVYIVSASSQGWSLSQKVLLLK